MESCLEYKYSSIGSDLSVTDNVVIEGCASLFGQPDQGGDIVRKGAYAASLAALKRDGRAVRMLWQHDPAQPIGVWDEVREDDRGLWVKGRLLETVGKGREAAALIAAGAIDGLSIGYRTRRAAKNDKGQRVLTELDLWEVSLVTFPMLASARVGAKSGAIDDRDLREMASALTAASEEMARG
ncbi:MAG: HK97 family phage prohead protease [Thalassovita sp.]|nr:HK97 family phage prohead protease [Thalassovita sp.]